MATGQGIGRETDLYGPVRDFLVERGYEVRSEVEGCDVVAVKDDDLIIVELKRRPSLALLIQAAQRQRLTDSVYVALPRPEGREMSLRWRRLQHLLHRLELGLILVSFSTAVPTVEVAFHPLPFQRRRDSRRRRAIIQEIAGRSGEYNQGGSSRRGILTAYREKALFIACCLDRHGPLTPARLRDLGAGEKTLSILSRNVYGWFERVDVGVYALRPCGRQALEGYADLVAQFRRALDGQPAREG
ncbi:MAG: DUF2161 family putative PD-(D/E)XK-type phosphodiesterase [Anaerolineae bacterium]|nr:DUF2161 family putative PD-(D/E)XK-type phosphodiesterase [Anaerolineae bacterium]